MALICELDEQWSFVLAVKPGNTGSGTGDASN
ncbi:Transposase [Shigella dysenteriae 1617]|uniref:Transposase n=1 Tax=Shigella dysenteriae 1617 TaxID=754093 RepID=A0A0A6ZRU3_SHIDY|nr:Transposase [Shigella dysenteriae 1617]